MRLFRVTTPDDEFRPTPTYSIEARHRWALPGVDCPVCGETWSNVGLSYPAFDLSSLPNVKQYEKARAVPLDVWNRLREAVKPVVPAGTLLEPGATFGPLVGTAQGQFGDFAWLSKWRLFLQKSTLSRLESAGIHSLVTVPTQLTARGEPVPELLELHIEPGAWLVHGEREVEPCSGCGRREFSRTSGQPLVIDRATVPAGRLLFRLRDLSTHIIATQEFRDAVASFQFSNIKFENIEVS